MRNLAQRSAQAAKEIKGMINDSVEKVDAGSKLVHDAGTSMNQIVGQVRQVSDLIGEITSAALEQSSGIEQVNEAVTQMDQVTQQNASLVEEGAAAAASLREQAEKLAEVVAVFKLSGMESTSVIARAQASAARGASGPVGGPQMKRPAARANAAAAPSPQPVAHEGKSGDNWEEF